MATPEVGNLEGRRMRAQHVADALGQFIGTLHAARLTALIWIRQAENPAYRHPKKYGLQIAFVTAALTLRKFQDFWRAQQLAELIPPDTPELLDARWVVDETNARSLRRVANHLLAHSSENVRGLLLSDEEQAELYRLSRWQDDNDLVDVLGRMLERLLDLHGALRRLYALNGDVPEHEVG
jgi:hypothetical protein